MGQMGLVAEVLALLPQDHGCFVQLQMRSPLGRGSNQKPQDRLNRCPCTLEAREASNREGREEEVVMMGSRKGNRKQLG